MLRAAAANPVACGNLPSEHFVWARLLGAGYLCFAGYADARPQYRLSEKGRAYLLARQHDYRAG